ncbi:hypothetical protein [Limnoglobus roseus]|uniref:Uncharacterized protein n=1 Tax=Limnoglobus roseus TaxID=2598579 RepID=A0A5C1ANY6_9BACT|nr:hypothetical protein [Limnoglobus roseus]QEL20710.1 hypothetical protein PX52LOC_07819 [Limnoglobus roseus]
MATFRPSHFASPETLAAVHPPRLATFLHPHREFLLARGFPLPPADAPAPVDFARLAQIFLAPDQDTPADLIDALYYVDRLATPEGMADLLGAARDRGLALAAGDDVTPADVAVQVWLQAPRLLERVEAEQFLEHPRSFEYYQADGADPPPAAAPGEEARARLEARLNDWCEEHRRGRTARVFVSRRDGVAYFLIRHGEPFKREGSVLDNEPASVAYRPLRHDVAVYDPALGELRVHAQLKGERQLYRQAIAEYLGGPDGYFGREAKYSLHPIRRDGEGCLACGDVGGLEAVRLRELHYAWGGKHREYHVEKADDLFAALRDRGNRPIPTLPRLAKAVFAVWFPGAKRPRSVAIKVPNTALYTRDGDSGRVERWLQLRGFLRAEADADDLAADAVLVGA